jgi:hypothetical protein
MSFQHLPLWQNEAILFSRIRDGKQLKPTERETNGRHLATLAPSVTVRVGQV